MVEVVEGLCGNFVWIAVGVIRFYCSTVILSGK